MSDIKTDKLPKVKWAEDEVSRIVEGRLDPYELYDNIKRVRNGFELLAQHDSRFFIKIRKRVEVNSDFNNPVAQIFGNTEDGMYKLGIEDKRVEWLLGLRVYVPHDEEDVEKFINLESQALNEVWNRAINKAKAIS